MKKVGVLVGSLRQGSFNKKLALVAKQLAASSLDLELIEIGHLPFYNEDMEANAPAAWTAFREKIKSCDAILFFTPEYNRSTAPALKNALDVGSRPYGKSVWDGKPCAVISASIGAIGGFGANHHLRQSFVFLNMPCMPGPEAYIGNAASLFNDKGELINEGTKTFLQQVMQAFGDWVNKFSK